MRWDVSIITGMLCACGQRGCIEVYTSEDNALKNMGVQDIHQLNALLDCGHTPEYILRCLEIYRSNADINYPVCYAYDPEVIIFEKGEESLQHRS